MTKRGSEPTDLRRVAEDLGSRSDIERAVDELTQTIEDCSLRLERLCPENAVGRMTAAARRSETGNTSTHGTDHWPLEGWQPEGIWGQMRQRGESRRVEPDPTRRTPARHS